MDSQVGQQETRKTIFRHRTPPGAAPGSLVSDPEAPFPRINLLAWTDGEFKEMESVDIDELDTQIRDWPVKWINVDGLGDATTLQKIADIFGVHKLAMEDVVHVHQRSKVEEYEDRLFIVIRMPSLIDEGIRTEQVSIFVGPDFVLTFQERKGDCLDPVRNRIRKGKGRIRHAGSDYLAYAIIDTVIDSWFPIMEVCGVILQDLEDEILQEPTQKNVGEIHLVKRDLLEIRRSIWPMRETISELFRDERLIEKETLLYLRDCYDHVIQIIDIVESYRDMASNLMDLYLSSVSNRMNEIMKVLTVIATIFIPLTFIAGIYGMNFSPEASPLNMPELKWKYGYLAVWFLMLGIGGVMLVFFRRRGWLGSGKSGKSAR